MPIFCRTSITVHLCGESTLRILGVIYQNPHNNLQELLGFSNWVTHSFIRKLLVLIFQYLNDLYPTFISELFSTKVSITCEEVISFICHPQTLSSIFFFIGSLIWDRFPKAVKHSQWIDRRVKLSPNKLYLLTW